MRALGLDLHRAAPKRDIDTIDDLAAVAAELPPAAHRRRRPRSPRLPDLTGTVA